MKKAALVIGKQNSGKSTTLKEFSELVGERGKKKFSLNGKAGFIAYCSFEEYDYDPAVLIEGQAKDDYFYLAFACQGSQLQEVLKALKKASYAICEVRIERPQDGAEKAKEIFTFFNINVEKQRV